MAHCDTLFSCALKIFLLTYLLTYLPNKDVHTALLPIFWDHKLPTDRDNSEWHAVQWYWKIPEPWMGIPKSVHTASGSPKTCRRSEWPRITQWQPLSLIIAGLNSKHIIFITIIIHQSHHQSSTPSQSHSQAFCFGGINLSSNLGAPFELFSQTYNAESWEI